MSTSNPGSPDEANGQRGVPVILVLIVGVLALIFMLLVGPRLLDVLTAVLAPPLPPLPPQVTELSHDSIAHGVDRWQYSTTEDLCQLLSYYRPLAVDCPVLPPGCGGADEPDPNLQAYCVGTDTFSIFAMRWEMRVPLRSVAAGPLRFDLDRNVFWDGTLPSDVLDSPYRNP